MTRKAFIILSSLIVLMATAVSAQDFSFGISEVTVDPVQWAGSVEKKSDTEYILNYEATIEEGWYIYAQKSPAGIPFNFEFLQKDAGVSREKFAQESETKTAFDEIFEEDVIKYVGQNPVLSMPITLTDKSITIVKSVINYQVCKEVCIPQDFYIAHNLKTGKAKVFTDYNEFEKYGASPAQKDKGDSDDDYEEDESTSNKGLWTVFFLSFLGGLAALFTPCVFPMIPMTVSYFTKQSKSRAAGIRNAIIYGISIIIIYVVIGLTVTAIFGATAIVEVSTSVTFNLVFFVLLVVFAISFFGAFEIMLPQKWANKIDRKADRGGYLGIFFMALALAIVSFSCTGPIVGVALVQSITEGGITPIISMLGFSSAIALPFALFAMFPGWLNSLPKSGGWLNTVKVVLGFLELGLALKFLSNADLVVDGNYLPREVFLVLLIAIMIGLALYLFGKIKLAHDTEVKHISVGRLLLGILTTAFILYLIPGVWGAPLKLISGFPPPMNYSESPYGIGGQNTLSESSEEFPDNAEIGPHGLLSFVDYEAGMAYARQENKPVLLDFTGKACVNCRRMEELVWSKPEVLNLLKNDVVLISLYGDSQEELPKEEQGVSASGRRIKTVGNKWSNFQIERYNIVAAPYYVMLDHDETLLNKPVGYTPNAKKYEKWLEKAIITFNNQ
ncbi:protein-disulfide reductase DsbD family protein [Dokdonia donghaensis]|uniref:Thiol:disulfide interchange protein DsbD n=1 Tax=Dokdonia donghaensis DSW-1 TaxID=1300343 RepID=A0A0A2GS84_9FLAO|nr:thioredoxin family protein [Dokdonia donghaensis]ANH61560.1 Thiol:disulfide interchange protein DsbD precursor [Dokdonia donghaensis DSW-1]KGO06159.1 thiol:disulfide interchange protein DsbD [Dokdonia donghaensis DSW-1]